MPRLKIVESFSKPKKIIQVNDEYILMFDGGSRGNPGLSGAGFVIYKNTIEIAYGYRYLGKATNNIAEYSALILGLEAANIIGLKKLVIKGDSKLVLLQVSGEWSVKSEQLKPLCKKAVSLIHKFSYSRLEHIKRNFNKRADELANEAMNKQSTYNWFINQ